MYFLQIAVLAVIQGAAELLPVSSSAHVILAQRAMGMDPSQPKQVFLLVMLHTGTMFAVLVYFWKRWRRLLSAPADSQTPSPRWHFLGMIVLATALTGFLGLGLKEFIGSCIILVGLLKYPKGQIEDLFKHLPLIAGALAAVGVVIVMAGFWEATAATGRLTLRATVWIGLVQGLC